MWQNVTKHFEFTVQLSQTGFVLVGRFILLFEQFDCNFESFLFDWPETNGDSFVTTFSVLEWIVND